MLRQPPPRQRRRPALRHPLERALLPTSALLSLGPRSYIGFSTGWGYDDWRWWGVLGRELGAPAGPAVPLPSGRAWTREFERVTARYDCDTRLGSLEWR